MGGQDQGRDKEFKVQVCKHGIKSFAIDDSNLWPEGVEGKETEGRKEQFGRKRKKVLDYI